jgi:hypothetical protein
MTTLSFANTVFTGGTVSFNILAPTDIGSFDLVLTYDPLEILWGTDDITITGPGSSWGIIPNFGFAGRILVAGFMTNEVPVAAGGILLNITLKLTSPGDTLVALGISGGYNEVDAAIPLAQITLANTNTAPVLALIAPISYTDTSANDSFAIHAGKASAIDGQGDTIVYGLTGGTVNAGIATQTGAYGILSLNTSTGDYSFVPNDAAIEAQSTNVSENFEISASDGSLIRTMPLVVNVAGVAEAARAAVSVVAYSWKAHTLLDGVSISVGAAGPIATTDIDGEASLTGFPATGLSLSVARDVPAAEATLTHSAVNLQDAIAILKMIVGLDVNGAGQPLSPYQALAADFDGDGTVGLTDAIGVLKHVVGLNAPQPAWHFLNELDASVPTKRTLNPGSPQVAIDVNLSGTSPVQVGLVGYLTGDVDGNYAGLVGALDLDTSQPSYFQNLTTATGLSLSQFGL